jgi:hypothetical protein
VEVFPVLVLAFQRALLCNLRGGGEDLSGGERIRVCTVRQPTPFWDSRTTQTICSGPM